MSLSLIEATCDTIDPGSPVHDATYNFVSSASKNYNNLDGQELLEFAGKIAKILTAFARLEEEMQWSLEDEVAEKIMTITSML